MLALIVVLAVVLCTLGWVISRAGHVASEAPVAPAAEARSAALPEPDHADLTPVAETPARAKPARVATIPDETTDDAGIPPVSDRSKAGVVVRASFADGRKPDSWTLDVEDVAFVARDDTLSRVTVPVTGPEATVSVRTAAVHRFRARTRGSVSATRNVSIEANARHVVVELVLEPATIVTGRVVDDAGRPADARAVWLRPVLSPNQQAAPPMDLEARTTPLGDYRFDDVTPGRWTVLVGDRGAPLARRTDVDVPAGGATVDLVTLPTLYALTLRVVDESGAAAPEAHVWSRGTNGGSFDARADANGELIVPDLPAGRFRVFAQSGDRRSNLNVVVPTDRRDAAVTLTLRGRK